MLPVFDGYRQYLKDKTGLELEPDLYWYHRGMIRGFLKNGKMVNLFRIQVSEELSVKYSISDSCIHADPEDLLTIHELAQKQKERITQLESESLELIREKLEKYPEHIPLIPCSGGKDSMVTLQLVRKLVPQAGAFFNNTSLDVADTYRFIKTVPDCRILNPEEGFYPWVRRTKMFPTRMGRACCSHFKSGVMSKQLDHQTKYLLFMGMRHQESPGRASYEDEWINEAEWGKTQWIGILPILKWTDVDIWLYLLEQKIPFNPKYKKGYSRAGCAIACPFYNKTTWALDEYWYPALRKRWLTMLEEDFLETGKACILNCTKKEYLSYAWPGGRVRDEPTEEVIKEFAESKGLSVEIAVRYFNNHCVKCGKKAKKDAVALSMKYFGRNTRQILCLNCLGKELKKSQKELRDQAERFKKQGCTLF